MTYVDPRTPEDYVDHMREAVERILRYVAGIDAAGFKADEQRQDAVIRNFEVLGEAAEHLRRRFPEFAAQHPEIPWHPAYGMRNVLIHGYFRIDLDVVWQAIEEDLPGLLARLRAVLDGAPGEGTP